ncbi:hypothetical protein BN1723_020049, partial [Verticillium longisporum]
RRQRRQAAPKDHPARDAKGPGRKGDCRARRAAQGV